MSWNACWLLLGTGLVTACDISFIAVEDSVPATITVASRHVTEPQASVVVTLPFDAEHGLVQLQGEALEAVEVNGDRWRFGASIAVDSLDAQLEIVIGGEDTLNVPLLARRGPAFRSANGDLVIPISLAPTVSASPFWQVVLVDSTGRVLVRIASPGAPLPTPLVLSRDLAMEGAVAAQVTVSRGYTVTQTSYPLQVLVNDTVRVPILESSPRSL